MVAIGLMVVFVTMNLLGIRRLARTNSGVTIWKVAVPALTILVLLATSFHPRTSPRPGGFFVHGPPGPASRSSAPSPEAGSSSPDGLRGRPAGGRRSATPQRDLPRAVIGATLICAAIYIGAQIAFIGALHPATLAHYGTWAGLASDPQLARAPFFALTAALGLGWLSWLLRVDAVISPSGTGLLYLTEASRLSFGLSEDGYVPKIFLVEDVKTDVPVLGVALASALGLLFLLPFPSWSKLVNVVTGAAVLMYAGAPLSFGALRRLRPDRPAPTGCRRPRCSPHCGFVLANFIVYWSGWQTVSTLMIALLLGYLLMWPGPAGSTSTRRRPRSSGWPAAGSSPIWSGWR